MGLFLERVVILLEVQPIASDRGTSAFCGSSLKIFWESKGPS
jgi:hypothetical protein